jgi:hypothetical protein
MKYYEGRNGKSTNTLWCTGLIGKMITWQPPNWTTFSHSSRRQDWTGQRTEFPSVQAWQIKKFTSSYMETGEKTSFTVKNRRHGAWSLGPTTTEGAGRVVVAVMLADLWNLPAKTRTATVRRDPDVFSEEQRYPSARTLTLHAGSSSTANFMKVGFLTCFTCSTAVRYKVGFRKRHPAHVEGWNPSISDKKYMGYKENRGQRLRSNRFQIKNDVFFNCLGKVNVSLHVSTKNFILIYRCEQTGWGANFCGNQAINDGQIKNKRITHLLFRVRRCRIRFFYFKY